MAYTIGGISLATVKREKHQKREEIDEFATPGLDSDSTFLFSSTGVTREIRIEGTYEGTSQADIMDSFILAIEALIDGNQLNTIVFHSDLYDTGAGQDGNFNVMLEDFTWDYTEGVVLQVVWSIVLIEGSI